jgi:hypothetical protein
MSHRGHRNLLGELPKLSQLSAMALFVPNYRCGAAPELIASDRTGFPFNSARNSRHRWRHHHLALSGCMSSETGIRNRYCNSQNFFCHCKARHDRFERVFVYVGPTVRIRANLVFQPIHIPKLFVASA